MTGMEIVFLAVPIGRGSALGAKAIWRIADCNAAITTRNHLQAMADEGRIMRLAVDLPGGGSFKYLYWREAA